MEKSEREEIERKIEIAAKKRDYACDILNKPLLGWTYQREIDELAARLSIPKPR